MGKIIFEVDRTLAELYTYILIVFGIYKDGAMSKEEYETFKRMYLYDRNVYAEMYVDVIKSPDSVIFADHNERALDVLNDLIAAGAINVYEYNTQKERHMLY